MVESTSLINQNQALVLNKSIEREDLANQIETNKAVDSIQDNFAIYGHILSRCHEILNMAPDIQSA